MSSIYGPMGAPNYRGLTPSELMRSALEQPLSIGSTFFDQAQGGILESFGLGTAIREGTTPDRLEVPPEGETIGETATRLYRPSGAMSMGAAVGAAAGLQLNEQRSLTEDQWKASPYFREGVPFDRGMTTERAQAIADFYDARKVREFYAGKRPVTSFFGNLGGQALDPINYIPIAGPTVKAAAVLRAGRVGGAILTSAADAALNTAAAALITAPARAEFGDDVSWQATVSQIAMAALIGGAFGGILGKVEAFRESRAVARAQASLETLKRVQEARVALNDAVQGLVLDGDVKLGGTSLDLAARAARDVDAATAMPAFRESELDAVAGSRAAEVEALFREQVFQKDHDLQSRYTAAEVKLQKAQARVSELEAPLAGRKESDAVALIDKQSGERLKAIEEELSAKPTAARRGALEAERRMVVESLGAEVVAKAENDFRIGPEKKLKAARKSLSSARQEYSRVRAETRSAAEQIRAANAEAHVAALQSAPVTARPLHEPTPEAQSASLRVGRPQQAKEVAQQHGVDLETGAYPEQGDIEFLRSAGRLVPEEEAALADADKMLEIGGAYGDAIKAAVRCLL